jgi:hypothetical protein
MHDVSKIDYKAFIDRIHDQANMNGYRDFEFGFCGGEPSMNPRMLEICEIISSHKELNAKSYYGVNMTTNLSKPISWYEKFVEATKNLDHVIIYASWHKEFGNRDEFLKNIQYLLSNGVLVRVKIVLAVSMFDEYYADACFFKENGCSVQISKQRFEKNEIELFYTDEQKKILQSPFTRPITYNNKKLDSKKVKYEKPMCVIYDDCTADFFSSEMQLYAEGIDSFTGMMCSAGMSGVFVKESSNTVLRGVVCNKSEPYLGSMIDFELLKTAKICGDKKCPCAVDIKETKTIQVTT